MENKICVYAICKNEEKKLDKWLESVSEADYIVVLDTGSTDNTFKKLKKDKRVTKTEQKVFNPWRFDDARNYSMTLIPEDANILVCIDIDEIIEPGWANELKNNWIPDITNVCYYTYVWSHGAIGEDQDTFIYNKIHDRNYKWIYPVHEVLKPINPDTFKENYINLYNIKVHHYQDLDKPRNSYFDLLKISLEENPNDSHVRLLYAREFTLKEEYEQAIKEYLKVLEMDDVNNPSKRLILLESLLDLAILYEEIENYDEAIWYCQEFIKEDSTYREPYFVMAEVYNKMKMFTLAEAMVEAGLKYGVRKYNWVEKGTTWTWWADDILAVCKYNLKELDDAIYYGENCLKYDPDNIKLLKNMIIYLKEKN